MARFTIDRIETPRTKISQGIESSTCPSGVRVLQGIFSYGQAGV